MRTRPPHESHSEPRKTLHSFYFEGRGFIWNQKKNPMKPQQLTYLSSDNQNKKMFKTLKLKNVVTVVFLIWTLIVVSTGESGRGLENPSP